MKNIKVFPYTIDSCECLIASINSGVTGMITNYPWNERERGNRGNANE